MLYSSGRGMLINFAPRHDAELKNGWRGTVKHALKHSRILAFSGGAAEPCMLNRAAPQACEEGGIGECTCD